MAFLSSLFGSSNTPPSQDAHRTDLVARGSWQSPIGSHKASHSNAQSPNLR